MHSPVAYVIYTRRYDMHSRALPTFDMWCWTLWMILILVPWTLYNTICWHGQYAVLGLVACLKKNDHHIDFYLPYFPIGESSNAAMQQIQSGESSDERADLLSIEWQSLALPCKLKALCTFSLYCKYWLPLALYPGAQHVLKNCRGCRAFFYFFYRFLPYRQSQIMQAVY